MVSGNQLDETEIRNEESAEKEPTQQSTWQGLEGSI